MRKLDRRAILAAAGGLTVARTTPAMADPQLESDVFDYTGPDGKPHHVQIYFELSWGGNAAAQWYIDGVLNPYGLGILQYMANDGQGYSVIFVSRKPLAPYQPFEGFISKLGTPGYKPPQQSTILIKDVNGVVKWVNVMRCTTNTGRFVINSQHTPDSAFLKEGSSSPEQTTA